MKNTKKGNTDIAGIMAMGATVAIGFVVFIVVLTLGGSLLDSMRATAGNASIAGQAAGNGSAGLIQISSQSTNIGLVLGMVIILMILVGGLGAFLYTRQQQQ
jgi:hypothetical protein